MEIMILAYRIAEKLKHTQRKMKWITLGMSPKDYKRNTWIRRRKMKVTNIIQSTVLLKWDWACHIGKWHIYNDGRLMAKRSQKTERFTAATWAHKIQWIASSKCLKNCEIERDACNCLREICVLQWTNMLMVTVKY